MLDARYQSVNIGAVCQSLKPETAIPKGDQVQGGGRALGRVSLEGVAHPGQLTEFSRVDILGARYQSVNCGAAKRLVSPNLQPETKQVIKCKAEGGRWVASVWKEWRIQAKVYLNP